MSKIKLRFFLDYGVCFWSVDNQRGFYGGVGPEDLPLPAEVRSAVAQFLNEYDQNYDWGFPPSPGWSIADCKRFNEEHRRILRLVRPHLLSQFIICYEQLDLTEDEEMLKEFYWRGRTFVEEQIQFHTHGEDVF